MYWDITVQVDGSNFTTTSTTLVDITGLTFAALANSTYEIEATLRVQSTTSAGNRYSWAYSAAATTGKVTFSDSTSGAGTNIGFNDIPISSETASGTTVANTNGLVFVRGVIVTGANAGNITLQVRKVTSGTATVYVGSIMKIKKLA